MRDGTSLALKESWFYSGFCGWNMQGKKVNIYTNNTCERYDVNFLDGIMRIGISWHSLQLNSQTASAQRVITLAFKGQVNYLNRLSVRKTSKRIRNCAPISSPLRNNDRASKQKKNNFFPPSFLPPPFTFLLRLHIWKFMERKPGERVRSAISKIPPSLLPVR